MKKGSKKQTITVAQLLENAYLYIINDRHDGRINQR